MQKTYLINEKDVSRVIEVPYETWTKSLDENGLYDKLGNKWIGMFRIAHTVLEEIEVATVFAGLTFTLVNAYLFETAIFDGSEDTEIVKHKTAKLALIGHKKIVTKLGEK